MLKFREIILLLQKGCAVCWLSLSNKENHIKYNAINNEFVKFFQKYRIKDKLIRH